MSFADALTCLAFSPDSQKVATGTARSGVTTTHIDADSKHLEMSAVTHTPVIVAWSSDGEKVMSASLDNMLHCWNTISSKLLGPPFQGHKELILAASFLRDSSHAVSLSRDGELLMWDTGSGEITRQETLSKYAQTIFVATLSVDGSLLVTSDGKQGVAWEIPRCVQVGNITLPDVPLLRAAIIPNSRHQVVLAFGDMSFWIWDTTTRDYDGARFEGLGGDASLSGMAVSPDGGLLALEIDGINDYPTRFYDRKGHEFASSNIRCIHPFAFSPDGKKFAASRVRSDSKDGSHKLIIHAVEEILGHTGTSLDVPATTTAPGDKGKQRAPNLPPTFFHKLPRRSGSVEGRAPAARRKGTGLSSISVANTAGQASPGATGRKRRLSLPTIFHPRSRMARSIAGEAQLPASPGTSSRQRRNPLFSRIWKQIRHPRSHKVRPEQVVDAPFAQAVDRVVVSRPRQITRRRSGKSPSEAREQERGHDQDRHNGDHAEYSHNHDNESGIVYTSQDTESVRAHGCWNIFWNWVCYKAF